MKPGILRTCLTIGLLAGIGLSSPGFAQSEQVQEQVQLIATGTGRAIVKVEGVRMVLTEEDPDQGNVVLISANSNQAVLRYEGREITLRPDDVAAPILDEAFLAPPENNDPVVLWSKQDGFFYADGKVNDKPVTFLVDTGADVVTFSRPQADKLGIHYKNSPIGYASTASGIATLRTLKLEKISIEHITLYDIPVNVVLGQFPSVPLLGGSFLNQLDMNRSGNKMELNKR
jgi:aspartyl protease family protein